MMTLVLVFQVLSAMVIGCSLALNVTENKASSTQFPRYPAGSPFTKGLPPGLEHILGVMGPLALAAMVSLPFVAPAAAALLPLASLSSVFGRRRRHLEDFKHPNMPDADVLLRRIHAAATRRNIY